MVMSYDMHTFKVQWLMCGGRATTSNHAMWCGWSNH